MGVRKKWLVAVIVGIILVLTLILFRSKATTPITDITWESKIPHFVDIAWSDVEAEETPVYNIFWSNQPGINIRKPETYRHTIQVSNFQKEGRNLARIYSPYEWVYFVIAKDNFKSKEYEASPKPDTTFSCRNLDPRVMGKSKESDQITIKVAVLEDADSYILRQYLPDGSLREEEFIVTGLQNASLRIPILPEALGFLAMKKSAETSASEFLFYHENLSAGPDKWETVTRLC